MVYSVSAEGGRGNVIFASVEPAIKAEWSSESCVMFPRTAALLPCCVISGQTPSTGGTVAEYWAKRTSNVGADVGCVDGLLDG